MYNTLEVVVYYTNNLLYLLILIFILSLELTVIYLQTFNLVPIFNLVISFDKNDIATPATIIYDDKTFHIPPRYKVLQTKQNNIILRERISKFKFQLTTSLRNNYKLPTICIFHNSIIYATNKFLITKINKSRFLLQLA